MALEKKTIFLFVPYIKKAVLEQLVENLDTKIVVVTTWKLEDLLSGSSELSLYPFCKSHGITLYINNRLHLKVYSGDLDDMILATANISQHGLGTVSDANFECATLIQNLTNEDRLYFSEIQKSARHVNDLIYQSLLGWFEKQEKIQISVDQFESVVPPVERDQFLISALPMTRDVETLIESYSRIGKGLPASSDPEIRNCVFHDLANYQIPIGLHGDEFVKKLKESFFSHPFIMKIDEKINPEAYFGELKAWVQKNCTDVPVPSRRELTGNVQVLLQWFKDLGDGKYAVDIPGAYSQRIRKIQR